MRALVTGGAGFLGKAIVRALLENAHKPRSFSRGDYPELRDLGVETLRGDITDAATLGDAVKGCDVVFHVAAKAGVWGPYGDYYQANVMGTQNILDACKRHGISRLVYTSSPSVVHSGGNVEGIDESKPYATHFETAYPETKAMAEQMVLKSNGPELATVALRPHLIWGPGDPHLVPRLVERARAGKLAKVGKEPHLVDSTYIDNAAMAHLLAAERLYPNSAVAGKAYFISQGEPLDIGELMDRIIGAAGLPPIRRTVPPAIAYLAGWMLEMIHSLFKIQKEPAMTRFVARQLSTAHWFNINAARRDLGYDPQISIEEGLRRLAQSFQEDNGRKAH
jgi:2-alkyl-3-oxoalkanoate reductase